MIPKKSKNAETSASSEPKDALSAPISLDMFLQEKSLGKSKKGASTSTSQSIAATTSTFKPATRGTTATTSSHAQGALHKSSTSKSKPPQNAEEDSNKDSIKSGSIKSGSNKDTKKHSMGKIGQALDEWAKNKLATTTLFGAGTYKSMTSLSSSNVTSTSLNAPEPNAQKRKSSFSSNFSSSSSTKVGEHPVSGEELSNLSIASSEQGYSGRSKKEVKLSLFTKRQARINRLMEIGLEIENMPDSEIAVADAIVSLGQDIDARQLCKTAVFCFHHYSNRVYDPSVRFLDYISCQQMIQLLSRSEGQRFTKKEFRKYANKTGKTIDVESLTKFFLDRSFDMGELLAHVLAWDIEILRSSAVLDLKVMSKVAKLVQYQVVRLTPIRKCRILFQAYDIDCDEHLCFSEFKTLFSSATINAQHSKIAKSYDRSVMDKAVGLSYSDFYKLLAGQDDYLNKLISNLVRLLFMRMSVPRNSDHTLTEFIDVGLLDEENNEEVAQAVKSEVKGKSKSPGKSSSRRQPESQAPLLEPTMSDDDIYDFVQSFSLNAKPLKAHNSPNSTTSASSSSSGVDGITLDVSLIDMPSLDMPADLVTEVDTEFNDLSGTWDPSYSESDKSQSEGASENSNDSAASNPLITRRESKATKRRIRRQSWSIWESLLPVPESKMAPSHEREEVERREYGSHQVEDMLEDLFDNFSVQDPEYMKLSELQFMMTTAGAGENFPNQDLFNRMCEQPEKGITREELSLVLSTNEGYLYRFYRKVKVYIEGDEKVADWI